MGAFAFACWAWDGTHWWVNANRQRSDSMVVNSERVTFLGGRTVITIPLDVV